MFTFTSHPIQHQGTFLVGTSVPVSHTFAYLDAYIGTANWVTSNFLSPNKSSWLLDNPWLYQSVRLYVTLVNKTGVLKKTRQVDWIHYQMCFDDEK